MRVGYRNNILNRDGFWIFIVLLWKYRSWFVIDMDGFVQFDNMYV